MLTLRSIIMVSALFLGATPAFAEDAHHPAEAAATPPTPSSTVEDQKNMMGANMMAMMGMMNAMTKRTAAKIIRNVAGVANGSPFTKLGISKNDH